MRGHHSLPVTTFIVLAFAVAMAYLEAAAVVYLQLALGAQVGVVFPLRPVSETGTLIAIEAGREAATLVMIASIGALVGRTWLERLAWGAVVFGAWDIGYYAWLYVFSGWPPSLGTLDVLFLLPVPWVGPVWSPVAVSASLVGVGLASIAALRSGRRLALARWHWIAGLAGGLLVILSYTLDAGDLMNGGLPGPYAWPLFALGMLLALGAAVDALRRARRATPGGPG